MATCKTCDVAGLTNTGVECTLNGSVTANVWFVPYFDSNGNINSIDCADSPFDKTYFDNLVNNPDKSQRVYPLPAVDNVEDVRADSVIFTTNGGKNIKVRDGIRSFNGIMIEAPFQIIEAIQSAGCIEVGAFLVDIDGNLVGNGVVDGSGKLAPFKINRQSIDSFGIKRNDSDPQSVQLNFDYDILEKDQDIRVIQAGDIEYSPLLVKGIVDVTLTEDATLPTSDTQFRVITTTKFGTVCTVGSLKGKDFPANWTVTDITLGLPGVPVVPSAVTENPAGTYLFDIPATPAATLVVTTNTLGYESNELTITTP